MNKNDNHKLWGGRFEAGLEKWVEEFGASISFDQKMAEFDLKGSIAHVNMLGETGIITKDEADQMISLTCIDMILQRFNKCSDSGLNLSTI